MSEYGCQLQASICNSNTPTTSVRHNLHPCTQAVRQHRTRCQQWHCPSFVCSCSQSTLLTVGTYTPGLHTAGECLGGALYQQDFLRLARGAGFGDPRCLASTPFDIHDTELAELLGRARFFSATYR